MTITSKIANMTKEDIAQHFKPEEFAMTKDALVNDFIGEYLMYCTEGDVLALAYQLNQFIYKLRGDKQ